MRTCYHKRKSFCALFAQQRIHTELSELHDGNDLLLANAFLMQKYSSKPDHEGVNLTLQAWTDNLPLPQIIEGNDKWNDLRADRIGDEMGVHFIIKGNGNEYQRIKEMVATNAAFILPLNFPPAMDMEDPNEARFVSLADMKNWSSLRRPPH
jgi:hypothetical protein